MRRFFLIALCFTEIDLKNVECRTYCRFTAGYDSGYYSRKLKGCVCADKIDSGVLDEKRLIIPRRVGKIKSSAVSKNYEYNPGDTPIPYKLPWE